MASTYLTHTPNSTGNRRTWTMSVWMKIFANTQSMDIMGCGGSSDQNHIQIETDKLTVRHYNGSANDIRLNSVRSFRDNNAWYHLVVRMDTTQSTEADRLRIYINGEQITQFNSPTYPSQNYDWDFMQNGVTQYIGRQGHNNGNHWNGLLSHFHWCDGYSYAPTEFGETDATTGEWKIKTSPSVNYGTNGFLILKDGNTITDQSSNSNDWSLGAGTLTKTEDNPSNVFCTLNATVPQTGNVSGRNASISPSLDNGNTTCGEGVAVFSNQLGTIAASSGKYYAECKFGGDQYCSFGVTSPNFSDSSLGSYPGASESGVNSAGIYGNGGIARVNGSTIFTDSNITTDTICLAMDLDNGALYIRRNDGSWLNSGNPESGSTKTGAISLPSDTYTWIVTSHNNSGSGRNYMKVNFGNGYFGTTAVSSAGTNASGNGIFEYDVPTGYTALSTKGLNT
jgi:hypothetical protein